MYLLLTKKRLAVVLAVVVLAFILAGQFLSTNANQIDLSTNEKRVQYINTLGIELQSDDFTQKQVVIPQTFNKVYDNYNNLQLKSGFNLKNYCGKQVTIFTYNIDSQTVVNLITFNDKLIGGDVASLKIDGEMTALKENTNGKRTF
jgi:hypothetical protein